MMSSNSRLYRVIFLIVVTLIILSKSPSTINAQICGDVNGDGLINIADVTFSANYLAGDGPPPPNLSDADIDGFQGFTIFDHRYFGAFLGQGGSPPICPPIHSPLVAQPNSNLLLIYSDLYPPNQDSFTVSIKLKTPFPIFNGFVFPLKIRLNGQIPAISTLTQDECFGWVEYCTIREIDDSGIVIITNLAHWNGPIDTAQTHEIAKITLAPPSSTQPRTIDIFWTIQSPINAPTQDSSLYPLYLDWPSYPNPIEGHLPTLIPDCCSMAGDFDLSSSVDISDLTATVDWMFKSGATPLCSNSADVNASCTTDIADLTYRVDFMFKGGPRLVCGCSE